MNIYELYALEVDFDSNQFLKQHNLREFFTGSSVFGETLCFDFRPSSTGHSGRTGVHLEFFSALAP